MVVRLLLRNFAVKFVNILYGCIKIVNLIIRSKV